MIYTPSEQCYQYYLDYASATRATHARMSAAFPRWRSHNQGIIVRAPLYCWCCTAPGAAQDVLKEAEQYSSQVLVAHESDDFQVVERWEPVTEVDVQTPLDVYRELAGTAVIR